MRPGVLRRAAWSGLMGVLVTTAAISLEVVSAPPAQALAVNEVYGRPASGHFVLKGHGWGHGRGMSQNGAQGAAKIAKSADQITAAYYPGTARTALLSSGIRVQLRSHAEELSKRGLGSQMVVFPASGLYVRDLATGSNTTLATGPTRWRVTLASGKLRLSSLSGSTWTDSGKAFDGPLSFQGPTYVRLAWPDGTSRDYRTSLRAVRTSSTTFKVVAYLSMESYLLGVVPRESLSSWAPAALQAQAIAARSYSAYQRAHAPSTRYYDLCDTTQCQVFMGTAKYSSSGTRTALEYTSTSDAVRATQTTDSSGRLHGIVRTYAGAAIFAEFSASNGGYTTAGSFPYLVAQPDPWDGITGSSSHLWDAKLPVSALEHRYGPEDASGNALWRFTKLTITERDGNGEWGGRVLTAKVTLVDAAGGVHVEDATGSGLYSSRTWPAYSDGLRSRWFKIVPTYDAALVSRSAAPTLVHAPGNPRATLTAVFRNSGAGTWPVSGLHLALADPAGGADPLAKGSTKPGAYVKNLTRPGATSVLPGDQVQLAVPVDATGLAVGTRSTSYRLRIGTASLFGQTAAWTVTIAAPVLTAAPGAGPTVVSSTFAGSTGAPPALFADGRTVVVPRSGSTTLRVSTKNTGNVAWPAGSTSPVMLGTSGPRDRTSPSYGSGWVSPTRAARVAGSTSVAPGALGSFALTLHGAGKPVSVTGETFEPVWNGQAWLYRAVTPFTVVRVDTAVSRAALLDTAPASGFTLVNAPTGTRVLVVRLRNVGGQPWTVGSERLGTTAAAALASGWPSSTRTPGLARNVTRPGQGAVHPGEVGEWRVPLSAYRDAAGTYSMTFRAVGPAGFYGPSMVVNAKVTNASFTYVVAAVRPSVDVPRSGTAWTWFDVKNTSNFVWPVGGALRSSVPSGSSPSASGSWLSATRPGSLTVNLTNPGLSYVRAGEVARFRVLLSGNGRSPRSTSEVFGMSYDGWRASALKVTLAYRVV